MERGLEKQVPGGRGCPLPQGFRGEVLAWEETLFLEEQELACRAGGEPRWCEGAGRWPQTRGRPSVEASGALTAPAFRGPESRKGAGEGFPKY